MCAHACSVFMHKYEPMGVRNLCDKWVYCVEYEYNVQGYVHVV